MKEIFAYEVQEGMAIIIDGVPRTVCNVSHPTVHLSCGCCSEIDVDLVKFDLDNIDWSCDTATFWVQEKVQIAT